MSVTHGAIEQGRQPTTSHPSEFSEDGTKKNVQLDPHEWFQRQECVPQLLLYKCGECLMVFLEITAVTQNKAVLG